MASWPTVRLGDHVDFLSGFAFESSLFNTDGSGLPLVRIRDVVAGRSSTYFRGDFNKRFLVEDGDYLIGMDGEFNLGQWRGGRALLNQRVCKIHALSPFIDGRYLANFLPSALKSIEAVTPFATVKHLSAKTLSSIELTLPPVVEQQRIADILDRADALRAKRREALTHLDDLTQSIFLDMFGDPVSNVHGWPIATVGQVSDVQGGLQVSAARNGYVRRAPYLRVANVHRGRLDLGEIKELGLTDNEFERTLLARGDALIVEGHGNPDEIGRVALWDDSIARCVHQNHLIRVRFSTSDVLSEFAEAYLNSRGGRRFLLRSGKTTSGLNTISTSNVKQAPIALPPVDLQKAFTTNLSVVGAWRALNAAQLKNLDALFVSLQQRAFAGDL